MTGSIAKIYLDPKRTIAPISPLLFGLPPLSFTVLITGTISIKTVVCYRYTDLHFQADWL